AIHNRFPYNTSPYLPVSALFRNFLYLDITAIEEFAACRSLGRWLEPETIAELRETEDVEYERVARVKLFALKLLHREFRRRGAERREEFLAWCRKQGETLERFAVFCALDAWIHRRQPQVWLWTDWPEEYRYPHSPAVKAFAQHHARRVEFYQWLQWLLDQQFAAAQEEAQRAGLAIGLYHDLALATDRYGCDLWAHGDWYVAGCRVGSPPDAFSPEGQDWSFPPPHRDAQRDSGYQLFRETIRRSARHGGALRIDHVMRFYRLYWIPEGFRARDGVYVRDYAEDLLRILALESLRGRFLVVGEDLGTVPPELYGLLERYGVLGYRVLYFERDGNAYRPASHYASRAVVTTTTHDLPALAGFWLGSDIEARRAAGLLSSDEDYHRQWRERERDRKQLLELLIREGLLPDTYNCAENELPPIDHVLQQAIITFLASTPSTFFVLNQEDLTLDPRQQNLPGSTHQHPNWRRKTAFTIEELSDSSQWKAAAAELRTKLRAAGRLPSEPPA
nr:4-alpha-glucanotransferase [Bryobacter sp.]